MKLPWTDVNHPKPELVADRAVSGGDGDDNDEQQDILLQMQVVLKDMLINVQRHQRELDRQHEALRAFIPTLLTENNEASIDRCEEQLGYGLTLFNRSISVRGCSGDAWNP